jgi:hypothetical protein
MKIEPQCQLKVFSDEGSQSESTHVAKGQLRLAGLRERARILMVKSRFLAALRDDPVSRLTRRRGAVYHEFNAGDDLRHRRRQTFGSA